MATRQTYYAESLGEDTTTSATYQDKVTCTFTPDASSDYYIFWSCLCNENSTSEDVFVRLYNSTDAVVLAEQNQELRTSSNYRTSHGIAKYTSGGSPASTSFKIQYASEVGGTTSKIKEARILVLKGHADDEYAEYLTADTTTSNSYVDTSCALTFTPATTGDYLVFASADAKSSSSSDPFFVKIVDPASADVAPMWRINRDGTNFNPYTTLIKQNLTNSSKTYKFQFKRTSAGTITLQNQRILALRLDAFEASYYAEDRARATTTSSTYVDDVSLTQTLSALDYIVFNGAFIDDNATTNAAGSTFNEDGSAIQDGFLWGGETGSGSLTTSMSLFVAYQKSYTAASHTWKRQWKIAGGSTSGIDEDAIAVLQVETSVTGYTLTCDNGSYALSGQTAGLTKASKITANNGSYALNGQTANVLHGYKFGLDNGSFTLTGQDATLKAARLITANNGSYALTGQTAGLLRGLKLTLDNGSYTLTGQDINFNNGYGLVLDNGSFTLTGQTANLIAGRLITLENGSYVLTGQAVDLNYTPAAAGTAESTSGGGWAQPLRKKKTKPEIKREIEEKIELIPDALKQEPEVRDAIIEAKAWIDALKLPDEVDITLYYKVLDQINKYLGEYRAIRQDDEEAIELLLLTIH